MQEANIPIVDSDTNLESTEFKNDAEEIKVENQEPTFGTEPMPEEKLKHLTEFRRSGSVTLEMTYDQFKKMKNVFKNDISWKGPNQAYLLSILMLNLEQLGSTLDPKEINVQKISVRNDSIEAMSVFINSIEGKNSHSAQVSLAMFLSIQQAIAQLQSIDAQIKSLEDNISSSNKKSKK